MPQGEISGSPQLSVSCRNARRLGITVVAADLPEAWRLWARHHPHAREDVPGNGAGLPRTKRILELNPEHALVTGLRTAHEANADDPALAEAAELLYGMALLAEGGELADPPRFTHLLADRLARSVWTKSWIWAAATPVARRTSR